MKPRSVRSDASPVRKPRRRGWHLRLYVAGASARSRIAVQRVHALCEGPLNGNCTLEVIDIYQQPALARLRQIVATPTLVQERPLPMRCFIGDLAKLADLLAQFPPAPARGQRR